MTTTTRTETSAPRRYETLAAAADRTGISTRTLRRRIADGSLPAYRTGRRIIRVSPQEVDQLMEQMPSGAEWS
ncbi:excisionase family DNA-binding protein [Ornithinimicrobium sufpigmenti]|uniref:excisionase family DNA-binding protein n=1 Tax=Ornithinimicrobium sufpigmenti TaxID=2508882 RepID=UPI001035E80F|nr:MULTISPECIES: excisionase family DNA-binding protein [unclassified Ornithinimicrobium]